MTTWGKKFAGPAELLGWTPCKPSSVCLVFYQVTHGVCLKMFWDGDHIQHTPPPKKLSDDPLRLKSGGVPEVWHLNPLLEERKIKCPDSL